MSDPEKPLSPAQLKALRACGERPRRPLFSTREALIGAGLLRVVCRDAKPSTLPWTYEPTPRGRQLLDLMALAELGQACIDWFDDTDGCHMCKPEADSEAGPWRHDPECQVLECIGKLSKP